MSKRHSVAVRVSTSPSKPAVHPDIREMQAAEKALQESYNSLSRHLRAHRGCRDETLAPNHGSMLHGMWSKGQLSQQQLKGWQSFYGDLKRAIGSSNSLVASMEGGSTQDYASRELQKARPGPSAHWNHHQARMEQVIDNLHNHERGLLEQLVRDALRTEGYKDVHAHTLAYLGNILSGYVDNRQCISAAVSATQRLLSSLGEAYGHKPAQ
jgi:hypothetical protein